MIKTRPLGFIIAALAASGAGAVVCSASALGAGIKLSALETTASPPRRAPAAPLGALKGSSAWLSPPPLGPEGFRGKVIVVNFWTYSCINSIRALPYLRAWNTRYGDQGLVVVGVHAPEFEFEKNAGKVHEALKALGVDYPNLQDNNFSAWRDFGNEGWPGFYFIDAEGRTRAYSFGEGHYEEAEQLIRKLLSEAGHDLSNLPPAAITATGAQVQSDWQNIGTPETYLGFDKATGFKSPGGVWQSRTKRYALESKLARNEWSLAGSWTVGPEYAALDGEAGKIVLRFHARDAHLVLGGAADGTPVRFRVTLDGVAPGRDHGADIDASGWGEVREDRLYQLVRQSGAVGDRMLTVEFLRPGVRAYVFTFG